jgi:hypothetical protein
VASICQLSFFGNVSVGESYEGFSGFLSQTVTKFIVDPSDNSTHTF